MKFLTKPEEVEAHHQNLRKTNNGVVQPYITALGSLSNVDALQGIEVHLLDINYPCKSLLDAYQLCFMSFWVFNFDYPTAATYIWSYIQVRFFEIPTTPAQTISTNLANLLAKVQTPPLNPLLDAGLNVVSVFDDNSEVCLFQYDLEPQNATTNVFAAIQNPLPELSPSSLDCHFPTPPKKERKGLRTRGGKN